MKIIPGLIQTWEDYDEERRRRTVNITEMKRKLEKAREDLEDWGMEVVNHLNATIGGRDKR